MSISTSYPGKYMQVHVFPPSLMYLHVLVLPLVSTINYITINYNVNYITVNYNVNYEL